MTTDIFVIYHDNLNIIDDIKNDIKYFKCNNNFINKYTDSGINIIEQLPEYQFLQPSFAEFTAFKMLLDKNLIEGDWVCTLQYDHDLNKNIIDDIKLSDEIMIFNPFGIGVNAVYNQNYSIGNENCMDWILNNYNLFFNKEYTFDNISEIPLPMCSAVKIKKETFNIENFAFFLQAGSALHIGTWPHKLMTSHNKISCILVTGLKSNRQ